MNRLYTNRILTFLDNVYICNHLSPIAYQKITFSSCTCNVQLENWIKPWSISTGRELWWHKLQWQIKSFKCWVQIISKREWHVHESNPENMAKLQLYIYSAQHCGTCEIVTMYKCTAPTKLRKMKMWSNSHGKAACGFVNGQDNGLTKRDFTLTTWQGKSSLQPVILPHLLCIIIPTWKLSQTTRRKCKWGLDRNNTIISNR